MSGKIQIRSWGDGDIDNSAKPNDGYAKDIGGNIDVGRHELHSGGNKFAASKAAAKRPTIRKEGLHIGTRPAQCRLGAGRRRAFIPRRAHQGRSRAHTGA